MQYLSLVVAPLAMMAIVVPYILRGDASARRVFEVVDAPSAVNDAPNAGDARSGHDAGTRSPLRTSAFLPQTGRCI
jgi:ABC-type multidrug transport system fused ATPase/permease subunit